MEVAERDAKSNGVEEMWLLANLTAVLFYKAIGWKYKQKTMRGQLEYVKSS